jgi:hypothetical protein
MPKIRVCLAKNNSTGNSKTFVLFSILYISTFLKKADEDIIGRWVSLLCVPFPIRVNGIKEFG